MARSWLRKFKVGSSRDGVSLGCLIFVVVIDRFGLAAILAAKSEFPLESPFAAIRVERVMFYERTTLVFTCSGEGDKDGVYFVESLHNLC